MRVRWIALVVDCGVRRYYIPYWQEPFNLNSPHGRQEPVPPQVTAPEGTSFDYMDRYMNKIVNYMMDSVPEATQYFR